MFPQSGPGIFFYSATIVCTIVVVFFFLLFSLGIDYNWFEMARKKSPLNRNKHSQLIVISCDEICDFTPCYWKQYVALIEYEICDAKGNNNNKV